MDKITPEQRHYTMSRIRGKDTKPEILVRQYLFSEGFRFRKNDKRYPGHPDIVLPKYRTMVFVNGCFWHGHEGCKYYTVPKSNTEFWVSKIKRNQERDRSDCEELEKNGWNVITVWECQLEKKVREETLKELALRIKRFLESEDLDV
ncbi:MAG TPA: very short patch repair endonuclease [Sphaerochaeta sp.]|nr:very short patch repair endonuclease [Sphaerochaeta sp.]